MSPSEPFIFSGVTTSGVTRHKLIVILDGVCWIWPWLCIVIPDSRNWEREGLLLVRKFPLKVGLLLSNTSLLCFEPRPEWMNDGQILSVVFVSPFHPSDSLVTIHLGYSFLSPVSSLKLLTPSKKSCIVYEKLLHMFLYLHHAILMNRGNQDPQGVGRDMIYSNKRSCIWPKSLARHGLWLQRRRHLDSTLKIAKPGTKRHGPVNTASIILCHPRAAAKTAISKAISFEQPPSYSPKVMFSIISS